MNLKDMRASDELINMLTSSEGFRSKAYKRKGEKYYTIGFGHSGADVYPGMTLTREQAKDLKRKDINNAENSVRSLVKYPINPNQFDSLVDLVYNAGHGKIKRSTLLKKLNQGDIHGAANEFDKWIHNESGGVEQGLIKRNAYRKKKFLTPYEEPNKQEPEKYEQNFISPIIQGLLRSVKV